MVSVSFTADERDLLIASLEVLQAHQGRDNSLEVQIYLRTSKAMLEVILKKLKSAK